MIFRCILIVWTVLISLHQVFTFISVGRKIQRSQNPLFSFGDPDKLTKWAFLRWWQKSAKTIDKIVFPYDPDIPGGTFPTPIEWAPWMETIWFGNAYEYRAAYFHDVMYSNNLPFKEGALLYSDALYSKRIAMLYQRYKKFDQSSYSVSNATFYNIFGTNTIRIGRYKTPLNTELILCATDPLTISEMKRYLNSMNLFKLFVDLYFQQKRKRQYLLDISNPDFFNTVVSLLEYDKINKMHGGKIIAIPTKCTHTIHSGTSGLRMATSLANSQYFLERLFQAILNIMNKSVKKCKDLSILIGGDGRTLNTLAIEIFQRIGSGNQINTIIIAKDGIMSTPAAAAILQNPENNIDAAIILTASHNAGGLRGSFGVKINVQDGYPATDSFWKEITEEYFRIDTVNIFPSRPPYLVNAITPVAIDKDKVGKSNLMKSDKSITTKSTTSTTTTTTTTLIDTPSPSSWFSDNFDDKSTLMIPQRPNFPLYYHNTLIKELKTEQLYFQFLNSNFDFDKLKTFIQNYELFVIFDGMHGAASPYLKKLRKLLGLSKDSLLRGKTLDDFGGEKPDPNLHNAKTMMSLFSASSIDIELLMKLSDEYYIAVESGEIGFEDVDMMSMDTDITTTSTSTTTTVNNNNNIEGSDSPDIGFAFDADVDRCMILGPGMAISPAESLAVLAANHLAIPYFQSHPAGGGLQGVARSMATAPAVDAVCQQLGIPCIETPTGWKYISQILHGNGNGQSCWLGGEESFGLGSSALPEKDGIWTALAWLSIMEAATTTTTTTTTGGGNTDVAVSSSTSFVNDTDHDNTPGTTGTTGSRRVSKNRLLPLVGVTDIMRQHWAKYGRCYTARLDFENIPREVGERVLTRISRLIEDLETRRQEIIATAEADTVTAAPVGNNVTDEVMNNTVINIMTDSILPSSSDIDSSSSNSSNIIIIENSIHNLDSSNNNSNSSDSSSSSNCSNSTFDSSKDQDTSKEDGKKEVEDIDLVEDTDQPMENTERNPDDVIDVEVEEEDEEILKRKKEQLEEEERQRKYNILLDYLLSSNVTVTRNMFIDPITSQEIPAGMVVSTATRGRVKFRISGTESSSEQITLRMYVDQCVSPIEMSRSPEAVLGPLVALGMKVSELGVTEGIVRPSVIT